MLSIKLLIINTMLSLNNEIMYEHVLIALGCTLLIFYYGIVHTFQPAITKTPPTHTLITAPFLLLGSLVNIIYAKTLQTPLNSFHGVLGGIILIDALVHCILTIKLRNHKIITICVFGVAFLLNVFATLFINTDGLAILSGIEHSIFNFYTPIKTALILSGKHKGDNNAWEVHIVSMGAALISAGGVLLNDNWVYTSCWIVCLIINAIFLVILISISVHQAYSKKTSVPVIVHSKAGFQNSTMVYKRVLEKQKDISDKSDIDINISDKDSREIHKSRAIQSIHKLDKREDEISIESDNVTQLSTVHKDRIATKSSLEVSHKQQ